MYWSVILVQLELAAFHSLHHLLFLLKIAAHYSGITGEAEERFLSNNFCRVVVVVASRADFEVVGGRYKKVQEQNGMEATTGVERMRLVGGNRKHGEVH